MSPLSACSKAFCRGHLDLRLTAPAARASLLRQSAPEKMGVLVVQQRWQRLAGLATLGPSPLPRDFFLMASEFDETVETDVQLRRNQARELQLQLVCSFSL